MRAAYIIIAHGSREKEGNQAFEEFIDQLCGRFPDRYVQPAYLELARPGIPEAIGRCVAKGAEEIFVIPMMLFPGRHVKEDIPRFIQEAKRKHPRVDFHYAGPLADHPLMLKLVDEKAKKLSSSSLRGGRRPTKQSREIVRHQNRRIRQALWRTSPLSATKKADLRQMEGGSVLWRTSFGGRGSQ